MARPAVPLQRTAMEESSVDLFDEAALVASPGPARGGARLPDGRALAWSDYGSPRGLPCLLLPDTGSSRLAPHWLLHDAALPAAVRMIAIDRPGIGGSDPIPDGSRNSAAEDLRHAVNTLAVGRVAVVGIGQGAVNALSFASRYPFLVTTVLAVSPRLHVDRPGRRHRLLHAGRSTPAVPGGVAVAWLDALGTHGDQASERTWAKAVRRMDGPAREVLGERWREPDFRQAVVADLKESLGSSAPAVPLEQIDWMTVPSSTSVRIWHGREETGTTIADIRSVVDRRSNWQLTVVDGHSAVFGAWPEILNAVAGSFRTVAA